MSVMSNLRQAQQIQPQEQAYSWTWHVMPALVAAAVLSALFIPSGDVPAEATAAQPMAIDTPTIAMLLVPSAQPGEGEAALVPADLPQSY